MRDPSPTSAAWRVGFAGMLLWAMSAATIIQFAIGALAPFLTEALDLSRAQIGILTTAFYGLGAACSPLAGPLVDRFGGRPILLWLFGLSGLAIVAMGVAPGYALLAAAAGLGGVATAAANPVTNQLIAVHLPRGRQGVIMGIKQSGVQVGAALAGALLPTAAIVFGWREALIATGVVSAAGVLLAIAVLPRSARAGVVGDGASGGGRAPRSVRFVTWLGVYGILMGAGGVAVPTFVVLYAVEALAWTEAAGGAAAGLAGAIAVAGRLLWGRVAELMRTSTGPLFVLAAASALSVVLVWAAQASRSLLWAGAVVYGLSAGAWNSVAMLAIVREVAAEATGWASGIFQAAFYVGLMACPPIFGWTVDLTGGYQVGWAGVTGILLASAVLAAVWHRRDAAGAGLEPALR